MFTLFFLHFVPFFSDWLNFVAQELKPKEKIYLVNKLHASCRLSHSAHIKTLRKTITITKRCRINGVFLDGPVLLCPINVTQFLLHYFSIFSYWAKRSLLSKCVSTEFILSSMSLSCLPSCLSLPWLSVVECWLQIKRITFHQKN